MKAGDTAFTLNGQEVHIMAVIPNGFLVCSAYEGQGEESGVFFDEANPYVQKQLFEKAPVEKYSADVAKLVEKIALLRGEQEEIEIKLRGMQNDRSHLIEKLKQFEALKHVEQFLKGKFTHYAILGGYSPPNIMEVKDSKSDESVRGSKLKLLSLFGDTNGDLQWQLNRYRDGSGSWETVIPCTSQEEAIEAVKKAILEQAKNTEKHPNERLVQAAKEYGVTLPPEYIQKIKDSARQYVERDLESAKKSVATLEQKLASLEKL